MRVSSRRTQVTRRAFLSTTLLARTNDKRASLKTGAERLRDLSSRSAPELARGRRRSGQWTKLVSVTW
jgi:hypothetical protein